MVRKTVELMMSCTVGKAKRLYIIESEIDKRLLYCFTVIQVSISNEVGSKNRLCSHLIEYNDLIISCRESGLLKIDLKPVYC